MEAGALVPMIRIARPKSLLIRYEIRSMRLPLACALVATLGASVRSVSHAGVVGGSCVPRGARVLTSSAEASVYRVADRTARRGYQVFACVRGSSERPSEIADGNEIFVFGRPALSLNGTVLGYAADLCDFSAGGDGCRTEVHVDDLAAGVGKEQLAGADAGPGSSSKAKVGSLRARPNGDPR